jgi:hypothetical protein
MTQPPPGSEARRVAQGSLRAMAWAALVFAAALTLQYRALFEHELGSVIPASTSALEESAERRERHRDHSAFDRRFAVWLVARNARAWIEQPFALFEAEPCHPAAKSLALGHPGLSEGLLGAPVAWLHGDPVVVYDFVVLALAALAALAMYWLVVEWTATPAAGIVAGLLFAVHLPAGAALTYPFIFDLGWTVLALLFGRRVFAGGGFRDALLLALCVSLQLATSFYALLSSLCLGVPVLVWLVLRYGVSQLRAVPVGVALILVAVVAVGLFSPYLSWSREAEMMHRDFQAFAPWAVFAPGRIIGFLGFALALLALVVPPLGSGDARFGGARYALFAGAVLVAWLATGGNAQARFGALLRGEDLPVYLPNLYAGLAMLLPGFDAVRAPAYLAPGVHLALCVLAGFGAAALLQRVPARVSRLLGPGLVVLVFVESVAAGGLGLPSGVPVEAHAIRPAHDRLAFFEELERAGNRGPLLEVPIDFTRGHYTLGASSEQLLLSAYHGRRTSGCYNSFVPPETRALEGLANGLPGLPALRAAAELGFTTIVVHHPGEREVLERWLERFEAAAAEGSLRLVHHSPDASAFEIPVPE